MFEFEQKVWCVIFGARVVRNILANDTRFPLVVEFDGKLGCYTLDGKYALNTAQVLFPYPVEIVKAVTKPSIDWSHVSENFQYLAMDEDGEFYLYTDKPTQASQQWVTNLTYTPATHFASFVPGTCDWKDSLVERPN